MRYAPLKTLAIAALFTACFAACAHDDGPDAPPEDDETFGIRGAEVDAFGKATLGPTDEPELVEGKEDAIQGRLGIEARYDQSATAAWEVRNQWADTSTAAAKQAGMAWPANSGLSWEQKFQRWVDAMERQPTQDGRAQTYTLITPWGKRLPAPALECAESAIFLRVAFASWYQLPFFMEAADAQGRIYFGHFGMRRASGKFANTPDFKTRYEDHSAQAEAVRAGGAWPSDPQLVSKKIPGAFDDAQPMLGAGAHTGAYFDQVFLNKRVGHFMITTLANFGSIHLADARNTYNVRPEGVRAGDMLVERWQRAGIGHVSLVMRGRDAGVLNGQARKEAELASGSMPRRQPVWVSAGASKRSFTQPYAGGEGYAELGGGLKRWRTPRVINGQWANVVHEADRGDWVNSASLSAIAARTARFDALLVELDPAQKRDVLLELIESKREHLRRYPASCSARIAREGAFEELYALMQDSFGHTAAQVDATYRLFEDYVFAELTYGESRSCCWNSSDAQMYEIVMDLNLKRQQTADQCVDVVVFKARADGADGYALFREHAASMGRASQWRAWRADERCPQAERAGDDVEAPTQVVPMCALDLDLAGGGAPSAGTSLSFTAQPLAIPDNDRAGVTARVSVSGAQPPRAVSVEVDIQHTYRGDLELVLMHPTGREVVLKRPDSDGADDLIATYEAPELVGLAANGTWALIVRDTAQVDTGTLRRASLTLR